MKYSRALSLVWVVAASVQAAEQNAGEEFARVGQSGNPSLRASSGLPARIRLIAAASPTPTPASDLPASGQISFGGYVVEVKSYEELGRMEAVAEKGRELYWKGHYSEAADIFGGLCGSTGVNHASSVLYLREKALSHAAAGEFEKAVRDLRSAVEFGELFYSAEMEKKAMSKFGKEGEKIYFGDPYERATSYMLLALMFLNQGDYDNALAACKSGLLADSDALENRYQSDFTLLYLLEARCHLLRGEPDAAATIFKQARDSYARSHPSVRAIISERADQHEFLHFTKKERRALKVPEDDALINARIHDLDRQLDEAMAKIDPTKDLGPLLTGSYNTVIMVPQGQAPSKFRSGTEADLVRFRTYNATLQPLEITLDGVSVGGGEIRHVADVGFQATTRGGRQMDAILKGKASFKRTTVGIGRVLTDAGNQAGGLGGLAVALLGATVQAVGGQVTPEADPRCWETLPAEFLIIPVELPVGDHTISFSRGIYFERPDSDKRYFRITGSNSFAVAYGPPSPVNKFSAQVRDEKISKRRPIDPSAPTPDHSTILLPPPLGLSLIEKFPSDDQKNKPRGFAPDPQRLRRSAQSILRAARFTTVLVDHAEILQDRAKAAGLSAVALQVELAGLNLQMDRGTETYQAVFAFVVVNVQTGQRQWHQRYEGVFNKVSKDKSDVTTAFYRCFEQALGRALAAPEFTAAIQRLSQQKPPALSP